MDGLESNFKSVTPIENGGEMPSIERKESVTHLLDQVSGLLANIADPKFENSEAEAFGKEEKGEIIEMVETLAGTGSNDETYMDSMLRGCPKEMVNNFGEIEGVRQAIVDLVKEHNTAEG